MLALLLLITSFPINGLNGALKVKAIDNPYAYIISCESNNDVLTFVIGIERGDDSATYSITVSQGSAVVATVNNIQTSNGSVIRVIKVTDNQNNTATSVTTLQHLYGAYTFALSAGGGVLDTVEKTFDEYRFVDSATGNTATYVREISSNFPSYIDFSPIQKNGYYVNNFTLSGTSSNFALGTSMDDTAFLNSIKNAASATSSDGNLFTLTANYAVNPMPTPTNVNWSTTHPGWATATATTSGYYYYKIEMLNAEGEWETAVGLNSLGDVTMSPQSVDASNSWHVNTYNPTTKTFEKFMEPWAFARVSPSTQFRFKMAAIPKDFPWQSVRTVCWSAYSPSTFTTGPDALTVSNVRWSDTEFGVAEWDPIPGAVGYCLHLYNQTDINSLDNNDLMWNALKGYEVRTNETSYDFKEMWGVEPGYVFEVQAVSENPAQHNHSKYAMTKGQYTNDHSMFSPTLVRLNTEEVAATKAADNDTIASAKTKANASELSNDEKTAINTAATALENAYADNSKKESFAESIKEDSEARTAIDNVSKAYAISKNITAQTPTVAQSVQTDTGIVPNKIKVVGAELSASSGATIKLDVQAASSAVSNVASNTAKKKVKVFSMKVTDQDGQSILGQGEKFKVPVTASFPIPEGMNRSNLLVRHYVTGSATHEYKTIVPKIEQSGSEYMATITIADCSDFAFVDETAENPVVTSSAGTSFASTSNVSLSCATPGTTIKYTVNGGQEETYYGPFMISETSTIVAYAIGKEVADSSATTVTFTKTSSSSGGGGGGGSIVIPTPTPDPNKEDPASGEVQDPKEYTDENGEIIPSKVDVPEKDASGTEIKQEANGNVTVKDPELGEAKNNSPAVFVPGKLYRLYNANSGEHFYTKNPEERDALAKLGWNYEANESVTAIGVKDEGAKPVYRVYNPNSGLHHYTTDKQEALNLKNAGWGYEGISFYAFDGKTGTGTNVYRIYCPFPDANGQNQHVYTSSKAERDKLVNLGYVDEGVCWKTK